MSVFCWVELDLLSLECNEVSSSEFNVGMGLPWICAACLLMFKLMFLCYWRICVVCLALDLVGNWVELGFCLGAETFV